MIMITIMMAMTVAQGRDAGDPGDRKIFRR